MSGKRQHHIPRFLLDGFASRTQGDNSFVWCFRKGSPPFEPNTLNVGLQSHFYGDPGKGSLDDFITNELETKHSGCVSRLRKDRALKTSDDKEILINFIHSLVIRTENPRSTMQTGFSSMLNELYSVVTDPEVARQQLLKEQKKNSPIWKEALTSYVKEKYGNLSPKQEKYIKKKENESFRRWLRRGAEAHIRQQAARHKEQLTPILGQVEELTKSTFNKSLKKYLQPGEEGDLPPRYERYRQLYWKVQDLERGSLILGDVTVLQFENQSGKFSAAYDGLDGDVILLPLSDDLLVIGEYRDVSNLPTPQEINRASAELSFHFFIASQNSDQEQDYQKLLGYRTFRAPKIFTS